MKRVNWKRYVAMCLAFVLVAALGVPLGNTVRAEADQTEMVRTSVNGSFISVFFTSDLDPGQGNDLVPKAEDFVVKVDEETVDVTNVAPSIDPDSHLISFMFVFLATPVVKGQSVTIQYVNERNPSKDISGNPLSTAVVNVKNITRGAFATPPVINLPEKAGYKLKAGDPIVTFRPTSGKTNRIQFTFPNETNNLPFIERDDKIHTKNDYVLVDNTNNVVYTPKVMWLNPDLSMVDFIFPRGTYLEEGNSYTLAMSSTAGSNKVRLPSQATTNASAWLTTFQDDDDGLAVIDEYQFHNLVLNQGVNEAPVSLPNLSADFELGNAPATYSTQQLATDDDDDDLVLSNARSDRTDIATADILDNQLVVSPVGVGSTHVYVDVSDGHQHTITVDMQVDVRQAKTPAVLPDKIQIVRQGDGTYTLTIADVPAFANVKVYDTANGGTSIQAKSQGIEQGSLTLQLDGGINSTKVYVTLTDTLANKSESNRTEVTLPSLGDKTQLTAAIKLANLRYNFAIEGDDEGQYPVGSKAILQAAIDAATAVKNNPAATQAQVDAAESALNDAVAVFLAGRKMFGTISISGLTATGVTLNWNKATGDFGESPIVKYRVYMSNRGNLDSVGNIVEMGTLIGTFGAGTVQMKVTGLAPHTTYYFNIVFTDENGNRSAYTMQQVTTASKPTPPPYPSVAVTGVSLDQSELTLTAKDSSATLTATVYPENASNKSVIWSSSNPKVAKVDENGVVTPIAAGTATITVTTVDQAKTATTEVKVVELVGLKPSEKTMLIKPNQSYPFKLYALYSDGSREDITEEKDVTYRTSAKRIADVGTGVIRAGKPEGKATITITYRGKKVKLPVNVSKVSVTALELQPTNTHVEVDQAESLHLTATLSNKKKQDVTKLATWSSSDPTIAEVDENGELTAIAPGTAVITAVYGGKESEVSIEVGEPVQVKRLSANKRTIALSAGKEKSVELTAYYQDNSKKNVTELANWSSADETVATVKNGVISGKAKGTVMVRATYQGKTVQITVTVK